jgi:hypothetical protein
LGLNQTRPGALVIYSLQTPTIHHLSTYPPTGQPREVNGETRDRLSFNCSRRRDWTMDPRITARPLPEQISHDSRSPKKIKTIHYINVKSAATPSRRARINKSTIQAASSRTSRPPTLPAVIQDLQAPPKTGYLFGLSPRHPARFQSRHSSASPSCDEKITILHEYTHCVVHLTSPTYHSSGITWSYSPA